MKLKTNIEPRRDGSFPKVEARGNTYTADKDGVYDVPDKVAEALLETDNFETLDGSNPAGGKGRGGRKGGKNKPEPVIIESDDGKKINLSEMDRDALVEFATELGLDLLESTLDKDGVIAAIMAELAKSAEDE